MAARSCSLSHTLMQTDTQTQAQQPRSGRDDDEKCCPSFGHLFMLTLNFLQFILLFFFFLLYLAFGIFASFLCTVSLFFFLFVFNQNALLLLLLLPAAAGLANTFLVSVSLCL